VTSVDADIDALREFHAALVRFRYAQRDGMDRDGDRIEAGLASLAEKASHWRLALDRCRAELDDCQERATRAVTEDNLVDCSGCAAAVAEAEQRLEEIRRWQLRVEEEASVFRGTASRFRELLENDVPRSEAHLTALIASLVAARGVQPLWGSAVMGLSSCYGG
jgi:phage shock protein A